MNESTSEPGPGCNAASPSRVVVIAELVAIFVFALEGAFAAIRGHLDLFGALVLAFATALGGGVLRDTLMGLLPPSALRGWSYAVTACSAAVIAFILDPYLHIPAAPLTVLDAAGLALFAVAGTEKALGAGIHPFSAILLGTITPVGGGTIRDVLLAHVPAILRVDVYATAALLGAIVLVACRRLGLPAPLAATLGGVACFVLRLIAVWQHWHLPGSYAGSQS